MEFLSHSSAITAASLPELYNDIPASWRDLIRVEDEVWESIQAGIDSAGDQLSPRREHIFAALQLPPERVNVVILGQDPYPNQADAMGLAFSIPHNGKLPPTLRNIYREYSDDTGFPEPQSGNLTPWVTEGVLLLNTSFTCLAGQSLSHSDLGWKIVTQEIISVAAKNGAIPILWGKHAEAYSHYFAESDRISSAHPSPLSAYRGFFGSKPFTRANQRLEIKGVSPINWRLPDASQAKD